MLDNNNSQDDRKELEEHQVSRTKEETGLPCWVVDKINRDSETRPDHKIEVVQNSLKATQSETGLLIGQDLVMLRLAKDFSRLGKYLDLAIIRLAKAVNRLGKSLVKAVNKLLAKEGPR